MTAPTESMIRAALDAYAESTEANFGEATNDLVGEIRSLAAELATPLVDSAADTLEADGGSVWEPLRPPHKHTLWTNLRPSECVRLIGLVEAAIDRAADRSAAIVIEEVVAAGVAFAQEYPDAPRSSTKPEVSAGA